jgi:hypothetical protein
MDHRRLEIVDNQCLGHAAEVDEGVLQGTEEVLGRLPESGFAVPLAGMTEHDAEHVGLPPLAVRTDDRSARAEVDLGLFARSAFHPPERKGMRDSEASHEPLDAVVPTREVLFGDEILMDPLGGKPLLDLVRNQLTMDFAVVGSPPDRTWRSRFVNGHRFANRSIRPGGRNGGI